MCLLTITLTSTFIMFETHLRSRNVYDFGGFLSVCCVLSQHSLKNSRMENTGWKLMLPEPQDRHHHASLSRKCQDFTCLCVFKGFLPSIMVCLPNASVECAAADFKFLWSRQKKMWTSIMTAARFNSGSDQNWTLICLWLDEFNLSETFRASVPVLLPRNWREKGLGEEAQCWSSVVDVSQVRLSQQGALIFLIPFLFLFFSVFLGSSCTQKAVRPNKTWKLQRRMSSQLTFWPTSQVLISNQSPLALLQSSASGLFSTGTLALVHSAATISIYIILPSSQKHQVLD